MSGCETGILRLARIYSQMPAAIQLDTIENGKTYEFDYGETEVDSARTVGQALLMALGQYYALPSSDNSAKYDTAWGNIEDLISKVNFIFGYQESSGSLAGIWRISGRSDAAFGPYSSDNTFWISSLIAPLMLYEELGFDNYATMAGLRSQIHLALKFVQDHVVDLKKNDIYAANRQLVDANALITGGIYTGDPSLIASGEKFLYYAYQYLLKDGTLAEEGGFDGSYQAVSLRQLGFISLLYDSPIVREVFTRGMTKYLQNFLPDGRINALGTRAGQPGKLAYQVNEMYIPLKLADEIAPELNASATAARFAAVAIGEDGYESWMKYTYHSAPNLVIPGSTIALPAELELRDIRPEVKDWVNTIPDYKVSKWAVAATDKLVRKLQLTGSNVWPLFSRLNLLVGPDTDSMQYPLIGNEADQYCCGDEYDFWERSGLKGKLVSEGKNNHLKIPFDPGDPSGGLIAHLNPINSTGVAFTAGIALGSTDSGNCFRIGGIGSNIVANFGSTDVNDIAISEPATSGGTYYVPAGVYHVQRNGDLSGNLKLYRDGLSIGSPPYDAPISPSTDQDLFLLGNNDNGSVTRHCTGLISSYATIEGVCSGTDALTIAQSLIDFDSDIGRRELEAPNYANAETRLWLNMIWSHNTTVKTSDALGFDLYISALKAKSDFWAKKKFIWPCLGDSLDAALVALQRVSANKWIAVNLTKVGFTESDYQPYEGLTGDGTGKYLATPLSNVGINHLGFYSRDLKATASAAVSVGTTYCCMRRTSSTPNQVETYLQSSNAAVDSTATNGYYLGNVESSRLRVYRNGTLRNDVARTRPGTVPNNNILIFASGSSTGAVQYDNATISLVTVGTALKEADMVEECTYDSKCAQDFQRWLLRAVKTS